MTRRALQLGDPPEADAVPADLVDRETVRSQVDDLYVTCDSTHFGNDRVIWEAVKMLADRLDTLEARMAPSPRTGSLTGLIVENRSYMAFGDDLRIDPPAEMLHRVAERLDRLVGQVPVDSRIAVGRDRHEKLCQPSVEEADDGMPF